MKDKESTLSKDFKNKQDIQDGDLDSLFFAFLNRSRFNYTLSDILEYIFRCVCLRGVSDNRRRRLYKKHFLFEKAEEKFMNELDVVRIVRSLRKFKMLS